MNPAMILGMLGLFLFLAVVNHILRVSRAKWIEKYYALKAKGMSIELELLAKLSQAEKEIATLVEYKYFKGNHSEGQKDDHSEGYLEMGAK